MRVLLQNRMAAVVAVFSMAMSACLPVTEIRDTFADKTAPDSAGTLKWLDLSNVQINSANYYRYSSMYASWVPSTTADASSQQVQRYIGSACDYADGAPVSLAMTANKHQFVGVPDGVYTFRILTADKKGNVSRSNCSGLTKVDHTPPRVVVNESLSAPTWVNASNFTAYPIRGTCTDSGAGIAAGTNVSITVYQGSSTKTVNTPCTNGEFNTTVNLTSPDGGGAFSDAANAHLFVLGIQDAINNSSQSMFMRSRDITLPTVTITGNAWVNLQNQAAYDITGTCTDNSSGVSNSTVNVTLSGGGQSVTGTGFCTSGAFTATLNTTTANFSEGVNHLSAVATISDQAGNSKTSATVNRSKDTIAPVLTFVDLDSGFKMGGGEALDFVVSLTELNATSAQTIKVSYSNGGVATTDNFSLGKNGPLTNEEYALSVTTPATSNANFALTLGYTDLAGNPSVAVNRTGVVDADNPQLTSLTLDGGVATTAKFQVPLTLVASDATTNITHFCIRPNTSSTPSPTHSCWRSLATPFTTTTSSKSITVSDFFVQLGLIQGTADYYSAWVRDELGHVSVMTSTPGVDRATITYQPGTPPEVSAIAAVNNADNTRVIAQGANLKVQWTASDQQGLSTNPVTVDYTTDDQTYLPFQNALNIPNTANACTPQTGYSACVLVPSPSSSYFRVRVHVKDANGTVTTAHTQGMNDTAFRIVAGNLDAGLDNAADNTVFLPTGRNYLYDFSHKQKFVVADDGRIFVSHSKLGILAIDPATRVVSQFMKLGSSNTASGVPVSGATVKSIYGLALDYQNGLLIFDFDRIRRVNLSTSVITTLIGGGSNNNPTGEVSPGALDLNGPKDSNFFSMVPLPNGDLLFSIDQFQLKDYRYVASTGKVVPINYTGSGLADDPNVNWNNPAEVSSPVGFALGFNLATSAVTYHLKAFKNAGQSVRYAFVNPTTYQSIVSNLGAGIFNDGNLVVGMDGNIYHVSIARRTIRSYIPADNSISDRMLGADNGNIDFRDICPDGTFGQGCEVDVDSIFVNKFGRVFFMEKGLIRMLDQYREVRTVYGKPMSFDGPALSSELGDLIYMRLAPVNPQTGVQKVVTLDGYSNQFRDFVFGAGITSVVQPIDQNPAVGWGCFNASGPYRFALEPGTDNIYSSCWWNFGLSYFFRGSNQWFPMGADPMSPDYQNFGGLPYYHPWADNILDQNNMPMGLPSTLIDMGMENVAVLGTDQNGSIFHLRHIFGQNGPEQCMLKKYDWMDWSGNNDWALFQTHFMGDHSCSANYTLDAPIANNSIGTYGLTNIEFEPAFNQYLFARERGNMIYQSNVGGNLEKFADLPSGHSVYSFTHTHDSTNGTNIYYCSNGSLYRLNKSIGGTVTNTALNWGSTEMKCDISGIEYDASINMLYFPVRMNGKTAIARFNLSGL